MAEPFLGEVRMFGGTFAPLGWALCNGQLLPIEQNPALFAILGTTYGGDGQTTFALPDLRGRLPLHQGQGPGLSPYSPGQAGGAETVTLTIAQLPGHTHAAVGNPNPGNTQAPTGAIWAQQPDVQQFTEPPPTGAMNAAAIANSGGGQPHDNRPPYVAVNFIIALQGIFPSPN